MRSSTPNSIFDYSPIPGTVGAPQIPGGELQEKQFLSLLTLKAAKVLCLTAVCAHSPGYMNFQTETLTGESAQKWGRRVKMKADIPQNTIPGFPELEQDK